jgi:hypothetical protein
MSHHHEREMGMSPETTITATARDAGRNVVHTVTTDNPDVEVIAATRRSAHRYRYAMVRYARRSNAPQIDGEPGAVYERIVIVQRWSRNPKTRGDEIAIPVVDEVKR